MTENEYEHEEALYEEYLELNRKASMTQQERDKEDLLGAIEGFVLLVVVGAIIWFIHGYG